MPDPRFVATLSTQGSGATRYRSWKSLHVRRAFKDLISSFSFSASEITKKGPGQSALFLKPGDPIAVFLGSHQVINGYVVDRLVFYDKESHDLIIQGKSKTCDVADSSVIIKPGDYKGFNVQQIANAVMQPHGVSLVTRNPPSGWDKAFDFATPHYGESCWRFINRLCNQRGLIVTDDKDGNLVAGQYDPKAASVATFVEGKNILRAVGRINDENAWSTIGMVQSSPGNDQNWGGTRAIAASAHSPGLTRPNRVLLAHGDMTGDADQLATRTGLESSFTASTIVTASVTVVGWFKPNGDLWKEGENVSLLSPMLFPMIDGPITLAVQSVVYAQDRHEGTTTTLELVQPAHLGSPIYPGSDTGQANGADTPP